MGDERPPVAPDTSGEASGDTAATARYEHFDHLLSGIRLQQFAAYNEFYNLIADRLLRVTIRVVPIRDLAEEAVGATFLELAELRRLPADGRALEIWMFRQALAQAEARAARRRGPIEKPHWLQSDEVLEAALAQLPTAERLAVHLSHLERFDDRQIAEILDTNRLTARRLRTTGERYLTSKLRTGSDRPDRPDRDDG